MPSLMHVSDEEFGCRSYEHPPFTVFGTFCRAMSYLFSRM